MLAVIYTDLRDNLNSYMDQITDDNERILVTMENSKNIVMMSEKTYNNLMENIAIYDWLMESKEQR